MKVLAVSSGGGHWVELLRLRPALSAHDVHYVTVQPSYASDVTGFEFSVVPDATRWSPIQLLMLFFRLLRVMLSSRPDAVISTGAAPGLFAMAIGRAIGARTIWVDSLANVDELSKSGQLAGHFADLWLTQWESLAHPDGPEYSGKVL